MGVMASALAVLAGLAATALLTRWLEPRLAPTGAETGPATAARLAARLVVHNADKWMYPAGTVTATIAVALGFAVVPFGPTLIGTDLGIGVFYFLVVVDFMALALALAGWGAGTSDTVDVYYRATAQLVAYVVPLGLAYIGAIMMARSLSTVDIVESQRGLWFVVMQPLGFALYVLTALMQCYRAPFLEPFSKHIAHGVLGAVGGWQAALWRLSLDALLFLVAAMGVVLFLGGWHGPWLPGPAWMLIKTCALMTSMLWLGRRVQPLSTAQMLALSWKVLIPVGLLNVLIVGALILLGVGP